LLIWTKGLRLRRRPALPAAAVSFARPAAGMTGERLG
jgi:hypothetical protein